MLVKSSIIFLLVTMPRRFTAAPMIIRISIVMVSGVYVSVHHVDKDVGLLDVASLVAWTACETVLVGVADCIIGWLRITFLHQ